MEGSPVRWALALFVATWGAPVAAETSHLLVIAGLGGEPRFRDMFHEQAVSLASAAETRLGLASDDVHCLTEKPDREPSTIDARSTLENVSAAFDRMKSRLRPGDRVFVLLIGHGSFRSGEARFNLPGPDLTPGELARLLGPFESHDLAVVIASSASGAFAEPLAGPRRVVVTATKSGQERNETVFGQHFVDALTGEGADVDKDGRVSILEAFEYAQREVERFYEGENRLQTEHPRLEDESQLARRAVLSGPGLGAGGDPDEATDPALAPLYADRRALEDRIEDLRTRKADLSPDAYQDQLEALLVELALMNETIDASGADE